MIKGFTKSTIKFNEKKNALHHLSTFNKLFSYIQHFPKKKNDIKNQTNKNSIRTLTG